MADVARVANASGDTTHLMKVAQITGDEYAGEDLPAAAPVYKNAADGLWYKSTGAAANAAASCWGFTPRAVKTGEPVTIYGIGARFRYGSGMTVGAKLYVSGATAGLLADAASTGGTVAVARVITPTDIQVIALT
jgi:hypothetical protein